MTELTMFTGETISSTDFIIYSNNNRLLNLITSQLPQSNYDTYIVIENNHIFFLKTLGSFIVLFYGSIELFVHEFIIIIINC